MLITTLIVTPMKSELPLASFVKPYVIILLFGPVDEADASVFVKITHRINYHTFLFSVFYLFNKRKIIVNIPT